MTLGHWFNSLRVQIVCLLTLALIPIGAVAVYQTSRVEAIAERNAQLALLALTGRTAKAEELILEGAFGSARFFATIAPEFIENPERCMSELGQFIANNPVYSFIGILPRSGLVTCSSAGGEFDFSGTPDFDATFEAAVPTVIVNETAPMSGKSVFVVSYPFDIEGQIAGFVSVSIPHSGLPETSAGLEDLGLTEILTFNAEGDILTARDGLDRAMLERPSDRDFSELKFSEPTAFEDSNQNGERRIYTIVPVENSPVTVMGVWTVDRGLGTQIGSYLAPGLFPFLMWLASMAVAILSVYTLVLRHIARLRQNMDSFAEHRKIDGTAPLIAMPNEFAALSANFHKMTDDIMREEAALEDAVHEKNVLIKEVHHRVKNNLQLISSIMNMQIRNAEQDETKAVLSSLQDRVISLATIHRDLYQSQNGGMIDVGALITEIVDKTVEFALPTSSNTNATVNIDKIWLYPDQAVPLSLLVAEGMTNMMKYLGNQEASQSWIKVSATQFGDRCHVVLANSIGRVDETVESTGLGAQLINAFAIQLGGKMDVSQTDDSYTMTVDFKIEEFVPEIRDF